MSLIDLKKSNTNQGKKKAFTVDEFIEDADNYAKGTPQIVSAKDDNSLAVKKAINLSKKQKVSTKRFKHATFTFNQQTFAQLNALSANSGLAKSHILRILIAQLTEQDKEQQVKTLLGSQTD